METPIIVRPVESGDADELFPLVYRTSVTDTILWDGPSSLEELRTGLAEREKETREGKKHQFTIVERQSGKRVGSIDIRPYPEAYRGDMGLWVGAPFQGKGYGTKAVRWVVRYGFETLRMEKIEAKIFVGNVASRRIFEKAGFQLEGTVAKCAKKRGQWIDEWLLGLRSATTQLNHNQMRKT